MSVQMAEMWTGFADTSCGTYSPIYDSVSRAVAASDAVHELVLQAPPAAHMPTVLLAAVHYLLLGDSAHPLAAIYDGRSDADAGPLFVAYCLEHRDEVLALLAVRHTNTNEVGRSGAIGPALTEVAARLGAPLALVDVGCSAGLNLMCDRYLLDYGPDGSTGPPDAAVRIETTVVGGTPPIAPRLPVVAARIGIDRDPVDLSNDDDVRWQLACVWPDTGRLPRTRLALDLARQAQPEIVSGDAVDTVGRVLDGLDPALVPVVVTTWAFAYLTVERRRAFVDELTAASRRTARPLAWVSAEGAGVVETLGAVEVPTYGAGLHASILGLVVFDGGRAEPEVLGFVHSHGGWIDWRAPERPPAVRAVQKGI